MTVQIFETGTGGHYTNYIEHLLAYLTGGDQSRRCSQIVVTTTPHHLASAPFKNQLARFAEHVTFTPCSSEVLDSVSFGRLLRHPLSAQVVLRRLRSTVDTFLDSVRKVKPDYLVSTTADTLSLGFMLAGKGLSPTLDGVHSVGLMHLGRTGFADNWRHRLTETVQSRSWRFGPWNRVYAVNPAVHERLSSLERGKPGQVGVVPNPVTLEVFDKPAARALLGIPQDGRYIGFAGMMDWRLAIPEMLEAFASARLDATDRLLLAGRLFAPYRELIDRKYHGLIADNRLIVIDRYLTHRELSAGYFASDVVAPMQYRRPNLSENVLKAIAAGRPVITNDFGYSDMIVKRFGVGWSCDVTDIAALTKVFSQALNGAAAYRPTNATGRLIAFHSPQNYAATVFQDLALTADAELRPPPKTWAWVLGDSADPSVGQQRVHAPQRICQPSTTGTE